MNQQHNDLNQMVNAFGLFDIAARVGITSDTTTSSNKRRVQQARDNDGLGFPCVTCAKLHRTVRDLRAHLRKHPSHFGDLNEIRDEIEEAVEELNTRSLLHPHSTDIEEHNLILARTKKSVLIMLGSKK